MQRAAYVTEAQAHAELNLPPLRQSLAELVTELSDPQVLAVGWRDFSGRLVAAVRARIGAPDARSAEIGRLTVVPDRQGQQRGTRLLFAIEGQLPDSVTELRLFTGERSEDNLRLYRRLGYSESSRTDTAAGYRLVHLYKTCGSAAGPARAAVFSTLTVPFEAPCLGLGVRTRGCPGFSAGRSLGALCRGQYLTLVELPSLATIFLASKQSPWSRFDPPLPSYCG